MQTEDFMVKVNRELNEEEISYREKFEELISSAQFLLQEDEKFAQCLETEDDYRYYNPMWFVSNYGYTVTVYGKGKILKTSLKTGGFQNGIETRWTEYVQKIYENWEQDRDKGYAPQYYFYKNSYPKTKGLTKSVKQMVLVKKCVGLA